MKITFLLLPNAYLHKIHNPLLILYLWRVAINKIFQNITKMAAMVLILDFVS